MKALLFFLILTTSVFSQTKNAEEILEQVKTKFSKIEDYEVDIKISVDMEFLRIPKVSAKVYFKQPDKMKMDSKDFAVLPKEGISFSPISFLKKNYSAMYIKTDTLDKADVDVVKIIPLDDSTNIILSTLWIDSENHIIRKVETTTKKTGTLTARLFYGKNLELGLPEKMEFNFNIENPKLPEMLEMDAGGVKKPLGKISKNLSGKIEVLYSNYKINQGLEDSFFEEETKK